MKLTVSVPGKINLLGEHAIVYGKPAILSAVDLRLFVTVNDGTNRATEIESSESGDYIREIIEIVRRHFGIKTLPALKIKVDSDIPAGFHLGSSAATAVGVTAALVFALKKIWNPELFNQLAYESEKKMHGNPSGGDNTIITFGGLIWYRKELEILRSIWQLPFKIGGKLNNFFLIDTGRPKESTGEMVALVGKIREAANDRFEKLLNQNETAVKRMAMALKDGNEPELLMAINQGEKTLEAMGAVSKSAVQLIRQISQAGGAAKILGGGGKSGPVGFLLCYSRDVSGIRTLMGKSGYSIRQIKLGEEGVRLEKNKVRL